MHELLAEITGIICQSRDLVTASRALIQDASTSRQRREEWRRRDDA
jgi:hypothetical protein